MQWHGPYGLEPPASPLVRELLDAMRRPIEHPEDVPPFETFVLRFPEGVDPSQFIYMDAGRFNLGIVR